MAEESAQTVGAVLEEAIIPLVPGLDAQLRAGIDVADIGCGSGRALNRLAALYPNSRFTGYDLSIEAVDIANREATALGLANVEFVATDATHLPGEARFDLIFTFRSEEHTSELQSLMRISYAVFCLKQNKITTI